MFGIGYWELVIILGIFLLLFGKRVPGIARSLGQSITAFKQGAHEGENGEEQNSPESSRINKA